MTRWLPWLLILAVLVGVLAACVTAPTIPGVQVSPVYRMEDAADGDTLRLTSGMTVRLQGTDSPEMGYFGKTEEPYAAEAKAYLEHLTWGKDLRIDFFGQDRYGRELGFVWVDGSLVNVEMVRAGLATVYSRYPPMAHRGEFIQAESEARRAGLGIWSTP